MEQVTVKTLVEHSNSFGDTIEKAKGATYDCPADTAASLVRDKLVEIVTPKTAAS